LTALVTCSANYITSKDVSKTRQLSSLPNALATGLKLQKLKAKWQSHIFAHRQVSL